MTFAELIHAVHTHPQHVVIPALWGQGRATFGGLKTPGPVGHGARERAPAVAEQLAFGQ